MLLSEISKVKVELEKDQVHDEDKSILNEYDQQIADKQKELHSLTQKRCVIDVISHTILYDLLLN